MSHGWYGMGLDGNRENDDGVSYGPYVWPQ